MSRAKVYGGRFALGLVADLFLLFIAVSVALPFIWMAVTSLKPPEEVFLFPPRWLPGVWRWQNYAEAWAAAPFGRYFANTVGVTLAILAGQFVTVSGAAYALARVRFPGRGLLFMAVLATMMIPVQVTFLPVFLVLKALGWLDSYWALTVPFLTSAFGIFWLRQAFLQVPQELLDAARIDGCGHVRTIWHVMLPLSRASLITFFLFSFVWHYNDFFWPVLVTNSASLRTLSVGIASLIAEEGAAGGTPWHLLMAAATFVIAPILALFLAAQRFFVRGMATTGLKG